MRHEWVVVVDCGGCLVAWDASRTRAGAELIARQWEREYSSMPAAVISRAEAESLGLLN